VNIAARLRSRRPTLQARDKELSLVGHLDELRRRLIVAAIVLVATTGISFVFSTQIIQFLLVPSGQSKLIALAPTENFTTYSASRYSVASRSRCR